MSDHGPGTNVSRIACERGRDFRADTGRRIVHQPGKPLTLIGTEDLGASEHRRGQSPRVRIRVGEGRHQCEADVGSVEGGRQTRASLEHLLGEPGSEGGEQAVRVQPPDAQHDDRGDDRRDQSEPEDRVEPAEVRREQEQHAGKHRPDLARHAVVEREDLCAPVRRDDVVERAPGGIRDAALGHLLGEPECGRGRERELNEPGREPDDIHDRQGEGSCRDAEARIQAVRDRKRHDERRGGHRGRQKTECGRELDLVRNCSRRRS